MKVSDILAQVNTLRPNLYSDDIKIRWLAALDGQIFHELVSHYYPEKEPLCGEEKPAAVLVEFTPPESVEDELLVPFPYGDDVYTSYLLAMIDKANGEVEKYNQSITAYSAAYSKYQAWFIRSHEPVEKRRFRF